MVEYCDNVCRSFVSALGIMPTVIGKISMQRIKWMLRQVLRAVRVFVWFIGFYLLYLLIGLVPLNRSYQPAAEGTTVYVVSSAVHADILVPIDHPACNWNDLFPTEDIQGDAADATHMAIGWGDRGFYLETPTWNDLKASTALKALFLPSGTVLHVSRTWAPIEGPATCTVKLSDTAYAQLCHSIREVIETDSSGKPIQIGGYAYGSRDAFYEARGTYHCFNTCNSWVGACLYDAGVKVPLFSPLPHSPLLYLSD